MTSRALRHPSLDDRFPKGPLHHRVMQVMTSSLAVLVNERPTSRKDVPPGPLTVGIGVLPPQRIAHSRCANIITPIFVILGLRDTKMLAQGPETSLSEWRSTVLLTFAAAHNDLSTVEIDVFHSQTEALHETQTAAIHDQRTQVDRIREGSQHRPYLSIAEDDWHISRPTRGSDSVNAGERPLQ